MTALSPTPPSPKVYYQTNMAALQNRRARRFYPLLLLALAPTIQCSLIGQPRPLFYRTDYLLPSSIDVSLQFRSGPISGTQILSTGGLREMHRVRMRENDWTRGNAIGFAVTRDKDKVYIGHGGSYPGYKTHTLIQLADKVGVIVLSNGDDSNPSDIAQHLMEIVGSAVAKASAPSAKPAVAWDPAWGRFTGLYRSASSDTAVVELNQQLVAYDPTGPNPERQNRLVPIGNRQFRLEALGGGSPVGEVVRFVEQPDGKMRIYTGGSYSERVDQ